MLHLLLQSFTVLSRTGFTQKDVLLYAAGVDVRFATLRDPRPSPRSSLLFFFATFPLFPPPLPPHT